eukprot:gene11540-34252_t
MGADCHLVAIQDRNIHPQLLAIVTENGFNIANQQEIAPAGSQLVQSSKHSVSTENVGSPSTSKPRDSYSLDGVCKTTEQRLGELSDLLEDERSVYFETLKRRHHAPLIGEAVIFRLFIFFSAIAVSLVVAYATGGFWVKIKPTLAQARVEYTNDAIIIFEGAEAGQERIWTTSSTINREYESRYVPASTQVGVDDYNNDQNADMIRFSATVHSDIPVYGVKVLLQFKYKIDTNINLQMYSLAYMSASSPTPGGVLTTDGQLELQQYSPITDQRYNGVYNIPILNSSAVSFIETAQGVNSLDMDGIIFQYNFRNYSTPAAGGMFEVNMRIRIPPNQVIWYRPQTIEMLKFGWIQFLVTIIPLYWFLSGVEYFVFRYRIVSTRVTSDFQPQRQKF